MNAHIFDAATRAIAGRQRRDGAGKRLARSIVMFSRRRARHRDRHSVPPRLTFVETCDVVVRVRRNGMLVIGEAVMVLRMIVVVIRVDVQRGYAPRDRSQNEHEQGRDPPGHVLESMRRARRRQCGIQVP